MQIITELRKAIEADGRTQRAIAVATGITAVSLNRIKNGSRRGTDMETICKLADALGYELDLKKKRRR